jgi:hypothetical protein
MHLTHDQLQAEYDKGLSDRSAGKPYNNPLGISTYDYAYHGKLGPPKPDLKIDPIKPLREPSNFPFQKKFP